VDDNQDSARTMALLLRKMGHVVETAFDGRTAVDTVSAFEPDIVLLDIGMPEIDGYEAARRIRALGRARPVTLVALTGWGQADDRRRSREAGFDRHLVKPVGRADLDALFGAAQPVPAAGAPETR
jgi:CheY-like chemotaxis protein